MKLFLSFCFLFLCGVVSAQWYEQFTIGFPSNELGMYYKTNTTFNDRYYSSGEYLISRGSSEFYKKKKVKRVEIYDLDGKLHSFCDLDTNGIVTVDGHLGGTYFVTQRSVETGTNKYWNVTEYWLQDQLMKVDSVYYESREYKKYHPEDTNYAYSINEQLVYMRGELINEQNRYYNEKYEGQFVQSSGLWFSLSPDIAEPQLYFEKKLRTDYDSLTLYKTSHTRGVDGLHHYIGENEQEWETVKDHPFFKSSAGIGMYEYYTDGADFCEPVFLQERMYCGYSSYNGYVDDGLRTSYCKEENGLYDTFYSDYYPENPNPPVVENINPPVAPGSIILPTGYTFGQRPIARLETPVRTPLLIFRYAFY